MSKKALLTLSLLTLSFAMLLSTPVQADGPDPGRYKPDRNMSRVVQTRVETRPDGVYVQISVRETASGAERPKFSQGLESAPQQPTASGRQPTSGTTAQTVNSVAQDRFWTDASGIYRQTPDGHTYLLTPPPIGSASLDAWTSELGQHPNETPYLLYIDGRYQSVVWIPKTSQNNSVRIEVAQTPNVNTRRAAGNGDSTDPRDIALSTLGHVPLPNIELRSNPALGLVHLPGWFWVEGYDGRPFGIERRVTVPPEVGDAVPFDVVPMDDPRRQATHYTVEVRIWPTQYEWDFGDGQRLATHSLGKAHPAESDIQHTYEHSSLGLPQGFPVRLTVTFEADYRVNGGPAQGLPSFQQTYESGYRVQEIQSVLTQR